MAGAETGEPRSQYPLVAYPNPRGPTDDETARDPIMVQHNWSIDEVRDVVKDLPDLRDNAEHWCTAVTKLGVMYQLEMVFRKIFKLRWVALKGDWNANIPRSDAAFRTQLTSLLTRVHEMHPTRTDWLKIHATRQNTGET
ncbi:hypothetical protein AAFF_G00116640 [Aldrovandia affinis]|uniref:Uncharacterized protein n=1 Tax=Aldrovandia affinis TaxID=143900 RepID=A0AAD7T2A9_9TELE|nr:hypothetical protein AAFF_G00116640 [Aldrovandia affinis]